MRSSIRYAQSLLSSTAFVEVNGWVSWLLNTGQWETPRACRQEDVNLAGWLLEHTFQFTIWVLSVAPLFWKHCPKGCFIIAPRQYIHSQRIFFLPRAFQDFGLYLRMKIGHEILRHKPQFLTSCLWHFFQMFLLIAVMAHCRNPGKGSVTLISLYQLLCIHYLYFWLSWLDCIFPLFANPITIQRGSFAQPRVFISYSLKV